MAAVINASYYHPDSLPGLECSVSVDWTTFFTSAKIQAPEERMKAISGLKIKVHAIRDKTAELTFDWTAGPADSQEQLESGLKQMIQGYFQLYWPMVASSLFQNAADLTKVEPLPDGGAKAYSTSQNASMTLVVDKEGTPTHIEVDATAVKSTFEQQYLVSTNPVPGDLPRISSMDVNEQIGGSTMHIQLSLDYQQVEKFYVPKHVTVDLVGAYTIPLELSSCSIAAP